MENKSSNPPTKLPKAYSCVRCFKRKVKCDKHHPCAACLRAKAECIFRIPAPPRRRHPRTTDEAVLTRLKHYEDLLRENGIEFNSPSATISNADTSPSPPQDANHSTTSTANATDPNLASTHRMPLDPPLHQPSTDFSQGKLIIDHGRARFIEKYILVFLLQSHC
jgi:Fungal Zn(2)-Cys(6) binuclear cluster domain